MSIDWNKVQDNAKAKDGGNYEALKTTAGAGIDWSKVQDNAKAIDGRLYSETGAEPAVDVTPERNEQDAAKPTTSNNGGGASAEYERKMGQLEAQRQQAAVDLDVETVNRVDAEMKALRASAGKQTVADRMGDTTGAWASSAVGAVANAAGTIWNAFHDPETNRKQIASAKKALESGYLSDGKPVTPSIRQQLEDSIARMESEIAEWESEDSATNKLYKFADFADEESQRFTEDAKEGLGKAGQFAVDVGIGTGQLLTDIAANAILPGSGTALLATRAFGGAAQEARHSGATVGQQLAYGAGSAATSAVVERIANIAAPFKKAFGSGVVEKIAPNLVNRLTQSALGKVALSALSEGGEELLEAVIQPVLKRATYDEDARFNLEDALYNAAIGATIGLMGGTGDVAVSRGASQSVTTEAAQNPAPEAAGERAASPASTITPAAETRVQATETPVPLNDAETSGTIGSTDARVQKALEMRKNGATTSQIAAETGLISMANGRLQDGIGGPIVWSGDNGIGSDRRPVQDAEAASGQRGGETAGNDGRGLGGVSVEDTSRRRAGEGRRRWDDLTEDDRRVVVNLVSDHADAGGVETQLIISAAGGMDAFAENFYRRYTEGDVVAEELGNFVPAVNELIDELDEALLPAIDLSAAESADYGNSVGAAQAGFETPGSQGHERTSNINSGAAAYTRAEGEATARTREEYDAMFRYQTQTEEQSMTQADNLLYVQRDGVRTFLMDVDEAAYQDIVGYLTDAPAWNGVMTDAAMLIKQELQGRSINMEITEDEYVSWLNVMREHATETGRGTQAWAKWTRRDNDGGQATEIEAWETIRQSDLSDEDKKALFQLVIKFDRAIEAAETEADLKRIILEISEERGTLSGLTGKQSNLLHTIAEKSLDGMDKGQLKQFAYAASAALSTDHSGRDVGSMLKTIQILNMLSTPKTPAKNIAGNTSFYALDAMTMRGAAVLDMVLSKVTGTRSVAMEHSVLSRSARENMAEAIRLSLAEITMDVDMGSGENRYQQGSRRTFKADGNFVERTLSALERNMGYLMTTTDEAYKGAARSTAAATQAMIGEGKIKNAGKDYAAEQADKLALYRTFQGNSKVTAAIQGIHDLLNMVGVGDSGKRIGSGKNAKTVHSFGLGDLVAPFTRVAGNLASVGMDYSPINAVKGTVEILDTVRAAAVGKKSGKVLDPAKQSKAVSDFARGMTGTAIAYGVSLLAKAGLVKRADDEDDKDIAALNQSEGMVGTQVNIDAAKRWLNGEGADWQTGDTLVDVSNLEPINFIVSLGFELADNESDSFISTFGDVETYKDSVMSAVETAGDLPILSNVGDFAKDVLVYGTNPVEAGAEMLGKTAVSSVTPNVAASLAKGLDDKQRNIYSGDGVGDVLVDFLKSRIPVVRESLPTSVNTLGEEKANPGTVTQRLLNAMLNPVGVNEYTQSDVSREMERVREATGETGFYPTTRKPSELSYKADGREHTVTLTYEQQQQFQSACSTTQMAYTAAMMESRSYKTASAAEQAALLKRCYDFAYQNAKAAVLGDDAVDAWVLHTKNAQSEIGLSPTEYLAYYEKYGSDIMSGSGYETTRRMVDAGLSVDQWATMRGKIDADDNGSIKKDEVAAYIEANFPRNRWSSLFDAYKGERNWKNPY